MISIKTKKDSSWKCPGYQWLHWTIMFIKTTTSRANSIHWSSTNRINSTAYRCFQWTSEQNSSEKYRWYRKLKVITSKRTVYSCKEYRRLYSTSILWNEPTLSLFNRWTIFECWKLSRSVPHRSSSMIEWIKTKFCFENDLFKASGVWMVDHTRRELSKRERKEKRIQRRPSNLFFLATL